MSDGVSISLDDGAESRFPLKDAFIDGAVRNLFPGSSIRALNSAMLSNFSRHWRYTASDSASKTWESKGLVSEEFGSHSLFLMKQW